MVVARARSPLKTFISLLISRRRRTACEPIHPSLQRLRKALGRRSPGVPAATPRSRRPRDGSVFCSSTLRNNHCCLPGEHPDAERPSSPNAALSAQRPLHLLFFSSSSSSSSSRRPRQKGEGVVDGWRSFSCPCRSAWGMSLAGDTAWPISSSSVVSGYQPGLAPFVARLHVWKSVGWGGWCTLPEWSRLICQPKPSAGLPDWSPGILSAVVWNRCIFSITILRGVKQQSTTCFLRCASCVVCICCFSQEKKSESCQSF